MPTYADWKTTYGWTVKSSTIPLKIEKDDNLEFEGPGSGESTSRLKVTSKKLGTTSYWGKEFVYQSGDKVTFGTATIKRDITVKPQTLTCAWEGPDPGDTGGSWTAEEGAGNSPSPPSWLKRLLLRLLQWLKWPKGKAE